NAAGRIGPAAVRPWLVGPEDRGNVARSDDTMTYRFILEVREALAEEAQAVVERTPYAEAIAVRRPGEERAEITVVAHAHDIIDAIYQWQVEQPEAAEARFELFGGERLPLAHTDAAGLKALIEGEHDEMASRVQGEPGSALQTTDAVLQPYALSPAPEGPVSQAERSLVIEAIDHLAIRVANIRKAEEFYRDFFQMDVVLRAHRENGNWVRLPSDYDWEEGLRQGVYVDLVYLSHPPLSLVLREAGRGAIFTEPRLDHVSLRVSPGTLLTIRAQALIRSFPVTDD